MCFIRSIRSTAPGTQLMKPTARKRMSLNGIAGIGRIACRHEMPTPMISMLVSLLRGSSIPETRNLDALNGKGTSGCDDTTSKFRQYLLDDAIVSEASGRSGHF